MDNPSVVTSPCIGTKDSACVKVCPVSCFYDAGEMLVIHPDECIDCGACISECPVSAIFALEDVPESEKPFVERNRAFFDGRSAAELDALRVTA
jgi:NAD-dependent dihydropyrimidine dehydrogenase PreA subunit